MRHVADAITDEFHNRLDLSDLGNISEEQARQAFLSRALAALTARHLTGCSTSEAAASVIDGFHDQGIDAVAIDDTVPHLWLIQAKWSDEGRATLTQNAALHLTRGLKLVLRSDYSRFNQRFQSLVDRIDRVTGDVNVKITLVLALMGSSPVNDNAREPLDTACREINASGELVNLEFIKLPDFRRMIRLDMTEEKVDLAGVLLEGCGTMDTPYRAFYGSMLVGEVAQWYEAHGNRLFAENIRTSLGLTQVNSEIVETLYDQPENFWYFNNGITVLCEHLGKSARYAGVPGGPGEFELAGASVVNGGQTVAAIHEAVRRAPETAKRARVWVRLISLQDCPAEFASRVTRATNTQNHVEQRDIVAALDTQQGRLRDEMAHFLGKIYVVKRGESPPTREAGCTVVEAARALACAHPNPELAVRAKLDNDALWERGERGAYGQIFHDNTNAFRVWRCVQLHRVIAEHLYKAADDLEGRARTIAAHGNLTITHLVFEQLNLSHIDEREWDWESELLPGVADLVDEISRRVIVAVDTEFGSNSFPITIFKSSERSRVVVDHVHDQLRGGAAAPNLPPEYRQIPRQREQRKSPAVHVLVDSRRIPDGTRLELRPVTKEERQQLPGWIAKNPARGKATWVNDRTRPLLWEADGKRYAPSALVHKILRDVLGAAKSVQGPKYWFVPEEGSLVELAEKARLEDFT